MDASALKVSVLEERIKSLESFLNVECEETIRREDEVKIGIKFIKNAKKQWNFEFNKRLDTKACMSSLGMGQYDTIEGTSQL